MKLPHPNFFFLVCSVTFLSLPLEPMSTRRKCKACIRQERAIEKSGRDVSWYDIECLCNTHQMLVLTCRQCGKRKSNQSGDRCCFTCFEYGQKRMLCLDCCESRQQQHTFALESTLQEYSASFPKDVAQLVDDYFSFQHDRKLWCTPKVAECIIGNYRSNPNFEDEPPPELKPRPKRQRPL
jgi:hypothetical protein